MLEVGRRESSAHGTGDGFDACIRNAEDFAGESFVVACPADAEVCFGRVGFRGRRVRSGEGGNGGGVTVGKKVGVSGYVGDEGEEGGGWVGEGTGGVKGLELWG